MEDYPKLSITPKQGYMIVFMTSRVFLSKKQIKHLHTQIHNIIEKEKQSANSMEAEGSNNDSLEER